MPMPMPCDRRFRSRRRPLAAGLVLLVAAWFGPAAAFDGVVEKRVFELPTYTTESGRILKQVRVGWESYGTLNAARDNAILVAHFFSGTSHAAGRYTPTDPGPGWWDGVIGPGKPFDTDRFFVLGVDTLVNLNVKDPTVTTTGPATVDPDTGKPYGLTFPVVTIRDFVNVQKALLDSLGIDRLYAAAGMSMGAYQAIEWAASYPERVDRVVAAVGAAQSDAFVIGCLDAWAAPIRLDPDWRGGAYYGGPEPTAGLVAAFKLATLQSRAWPWANQAFGRSWADPGRDPRTALDHVYKIQAWLDAGARRWAAPADANHFLYLVKALQTFLAGGGASLEEGLSRLRAPVLLLPAEGDLLFSTAAATDPMAQSLAAQGTAVTVAEIPGPHGHLNGLFTIDAVAEDIRAFLQR